MTYYLAEGGNVGAVEPHDVSDGFHTMGDLYDHRRALTAGLLRALSMHSSAEGYAWSAWRSKQHHPDDSPIFPGYFIVGADLGAVGPITYHYPMEHWDEFDGIPELPHSPKWDGHAAEHVVDRLLAWRP